MDSSQFLSEFRLFIVDRYNADLKTFSSESYGKLSKLIKKWIEVEQPSSTITDAIVKFEDRGKLCGYPFDRGDIIYRCRYYLVSPIFRECGRDPTCVLCSKCFNESDHVGHEISYSITCSTGGCCDCGDSEAWNALLHCDLHSKEFPSEIGCKLSNEQSAFLSSISLNAIADELVKLITYLPIFSIFYSQLDFTDVKSTFSDSSFQTLHEFVSPFLDNDRHYSTLLYNDELHSFDEVIQILNQVYSYPRTRGKEFANIVDKHGRAIIFTGNELEKNLSGMSMVMASGLRCKVLPSNVVYFEDVCAAILSIVADIIPKMPWLQLYLSSSLLSSISKIISFADIFNSFEMKIRSENPKLDSTFNLTILHCIILSDPFLWKEVRATIKTFFMNSLLKFYYFKLQLGICFTECYPLILKSFLSEDVEAEYSIIFFSVQLYTVPSIVNELIKSHDLFCKILNYTITGFKEAIVDGSIDFTSHVIKNRRYFHPFQDLRYMIDGSNYEYLDHHQKPQIIQLLLEFFGLFSEMNINRHAISEHIEYESDTWIHAFNISLQCAKFAQELQKYFVPSFETGCHVLQLIAKEFPRTFLDDSNQILPVPPIGGKFSFHHPVQWFISNILRANRKFCLPFSEELDGVLALLLPKISIPCLQLQVYLGQIRSNLWIRNGYTLRNQIFNYLGVNLIDEMRDLDLYLLQEFLIICKDSTSDIIECFNLESYLHTDIYNYPSISSDVLVQVRYGQIDHLLNLFINLFNKDISEQFSFSKLLRRAVIHYLFLSPSSNSELIKKLPGKFCDSTEIKEILSDVSIQRGKRSPQGDKIIFHLKHEIALSEVDMFYPYYSYSERQTCFEYLQKSSKSFLFHDLFSYSKPHMGLVILSNSPSFFSFLYKCLISISIEFHNIFVLLQILYIIHAILSLLKSSYEGISLNRTFILSCLLEPPDQTSLNSEGESVYNLLKKIIGIPEYSSIISTITYILKEISEFDDKNAEITSFTASSKSKKFQAEERKRKLLETILKSQRSFLQSLPFEEISQEEQVILDKNTIDEISNSQESDTTDSFMYYTVEEEDEFTDVNSEDEYEIDSQLITNNQTHYEVTIPIDPSLEFSLSSDRIDKYQDPLRFTKPSELDRPKYQIMNLLQPAYSFDFRKEVSIEPVFHDQSLNCCNVCHEQLNIKDTSKIIGYIAQLIKKRYLRQYSEYYNRGFAQSDSNDLLFLNDDKKCFDNWKSNSHSYYLTSCKHYFHLTCFKKSPNLAFRNSFRCPLCRKKGNVFVPYFDRSFSSIIPNPTKMRSVSIRNELKVFPYFKNDIFVNVNDILPNGLLLFMDDPQSICDRWNYYSGKYYLFHSDSTKLPALFESEGLDLIEHFISRFIQLETQQVSNSELLFVEKIASMLADIILTIEIYSRLSDLSCISYFKASTTISCLLEDNSQYFFAILEIFKIFITRSTYLKELTQSPIYETLKDSLLKCFEIISSSSTSQSFISELILFSILFYSPESLIDIERYKKLVSFLFVKYFLLQFHTVHMLDNISQNLKFSFFNAYLKQASLFECIFFGSIMEEQIFTSTLEEFLNLYNRKYDIGKYWISSDKFLSSLKNSQFTTSELPCNINFTRNEVVDVSRYHLLDKHLFLQYPFRYSFISLPKKFDQLIIQSTKKSCIRCKRIPTETAICLICGKLACFKSTCCSTGPMGECSFHMINNCCNTIGLFFLVQKASILYLSNTSAYIHSSVYLDSFGEPDVGFRRGLPLSLSETAYSNLENEFLLHHTNDTLEELNDAEPSAISVFHMMV